MYRYQWSKVGDDQVDLMHYDGFTQTMTYVRGYASRGGLGAVVPHHKHGHENEDSPPSPTSPPITRAIDALRAQSDPHVFTFSRHQMNAIADAARFVCLLANPWSGAPPPPPPPPPPPTTKSKP